MHTYTHLSKTLFALGIIVMLFLQLTMFAIISLSKQVRKAEYAK